MMDGWHYPNRKGRAAMDQMKHALQETGLVPVRATDIPASEIDLSKYLKNGGRCVVLGGRTTNFTDTMRKHAQFVFWDSTDPKARNRDLPTNARALLMTRFSDHTWERSIRRQARDRGVFCPPGLLSTGDIRDIIQRFLDSPDAKTAVPTNGHDTDPSTHVVHVEPAPKAAGGAFAPAFAPVENVKVEPPTVADTTQGEGTDTVPTINRDKRSWLREFVSQHADLDAKPQITEAQRVLALLKKAGGTSTAASIDNTMYQLRVAAGKQQPGGKRGNRDRVIRNAGIMVPMPAPRQAVTAPATKTDGFDSDLAVAMEMAVDAMKRVDDARAAMALAIDALNKLQREDKTRRERMAKIRAALNEGE